MDNKRTLEFNKEDGYIPPPELQKNEKAWLISQAEANYRPVSDELGRACAGCRWFEARTEYGGSSCRIVQSYPLEIVPTGLSNRYEALPVVNEWGGVVEDAPADSQAVVASEGIRATSSDAVNIETAVQPTGNTPNLVERAVQAVKSALQRGNNDIIAFKVNTATRSWVGIWSNNFEDREGEIFTAKAIDDYIARVDMGIVPTPELWVWHTPGTRLGQADYIARVGAFVVGMGKFDENPIGERGMKSLAKAKGLKMSHGFRYDPRQKLGRVYHQFNTFEISVLPGNKAANPYTSFEEIEEMKLDGEKKSFLEGILGTEQTGALEKALEDATASLTERGIASKELFGDFASVSDATADNAESAKEALDTATKALAPLLLDVLEAQGESAALETKLIGRIKELETQVSGFKAQVEQLQAAVDLKPRSAADSKETVDTKATADDKAGVMGKRDPFWNTVVG